MKEIDVKTILVGVFDDTPKYRDVCTRCNTLIFTCENLIGHMITSCNCRRF